MEERNMKRQVCSITPRGTTALLRAASATSRKLSRPGTMAVVALCGLWVSFAGTGPAPSLEQLAVELSAVKAELLEVRLELETSRTARLQTELESAVKNRQRFETRERTATQELVNFDQQGTISEGTSEDP